MYNKWMKNKNVTHKQTTTTKLQANTYKSMSIHNSFSKNAIENSNI